MKLYSCDFETNNHKEDCRIWAWGACSIDNKLNFEYGNTMKSFMLWMKKHAPSTLFFHNLRFDGSFIISYLLTNGYKWVDERLPKYGQFTTLISDKGVFYTIDIGFKNSKGKNTIIHIQDSQKIFNSSVEKIAEDYKLPIKKGSIDYDLVREYGHVLTNEEVDYLRNDVEIMARVLHYFLSKGFEKMTIASNALNFYKQQIGEKQFNKWFPNDYPDEWLRPGYRGGWVYLKKGYSDKTVKRGLVLDVNSLFPSRLRYELFPYGKAHYYTGKYVSSQLDTVYVQKFRASFTIKPNHLPTVQLRKCGYFQSAKYCEDSFGEMYEMTMTNVDLELFFEHYDIHEIEYIEGYWFKAQYGMFDKYIDYWMNEKIEGEKEGNASRRGVSKLFMNGFYGKFGSGTKVASKIPYLDDEGVVKYKLTDIEEKEPVYLPVAMFTTSYAAAYTIRSAQKNYDRFVYADTDSLHLLGTEEPDLDIDKYRLGAWKIENYFVRARFLRAKCYMEEKEDGQLIVKAAGLPKEDKKELNFDNFHIGYRTDRKLRQYTVKGGVILARTKFEIRSG